MAEDKEPKAGEPKEPKAKFLNPFEAGVNYKQFLEALGKKSVADYCKDHLTTEQIEWLEKDLEIFKSK